MKKSYPVAEACAVMIIGTVIFLGSFGIRQITTSKIGPAFMPQIVAAIIFLLGAGMLVEAVRKGRGAVLGEPEEKAERAAEERRTVKEWMRKEMHWINWVLMLAYACSMKTVGFLFSSMIYLFAAMVLLTMKDEKRSWLCIAGLAVILPTAVYIVFRQKFFLMLPVGWCKYLPFLILK